MAIELVKAYFKKYGIEERIKEFDVSSATVELAASALGCESCRIAKTLSFKTEESCILILAAGDAGADAIFFCEDMGTQTGLLFSPAMWDDYFRELYTRLFSIAHDCNMQVFMHSCGCNREILEPLLEAGVNCFQFDQPTLYDYQDLPALLKKYKAALWSPVDIQHIMPTGNRELIEKGAQDMFDAFQGGLILKNYPDLNGIGVKEEWDDWAYQKALSFKY